MSDLSDRASESYGAVVGAGGVFERARPEGASHQGNALPDCGCGGRPVYRAFGEGRFSRPMETLECGSCGNKVGPYPARHQLAEAWRLGGWRREDLKF